MSVEWAAVAEEDSAFDAEDRRTRELVRDLHGARPRIYWTDLLLTSLIGWAAFALSVFLSFSPWALITGAVAVAALYRGLCFMHEIAHQSSRVLPRFEVVWNLLIGYPLLMPSFVYGGVHQSHHSLSTYGTRDDPEYLPFARSRTMTVMFALESFFIPVALVLRFLILSPIGFLWPRFQRWLVVHFSSLTMSVAYRRTASPELIRRVQAGSVAIVVLWALFLLLLPWKFFVIWLVVSSLMSFVNTLRTLGAHAYESEGASLSRRGQLIDSIDTPGAVWTELWAPVGLRYHALHHYFPGIPYHNLPCAWRRVAGTLPAQAVFHRVSSPGLIYSLRTLLAGRRRHDCRRGTQ